MSEDKKRSRSAKLAVPKAPHKETAYLAYCRVSRPLLAAENPSLPFGELTKKLAEAWNGMGSAEKQRHVEEAERSNAVAAAAWGNGAEKRDEDRAAQCRKYGLPTGCSWEELLAHSEGKGRYADETRRKRDQAAASAARGTERKRLSDLGMVQKRQVVPDYESKGSGGGSSSSAQRRSSSSVGSGAGGVKRMRTSSGNSGGVVDGWHGCWRAVARRAAVTKGIDRVFAMAQDDEFFELFGNDVIQCFYDVATVTADPVRRRALKYVEQLAHRWKHKVLRRGWKRDKHPTPQEVIEAVIGMYCLERLGIYHKLKAEVVAFMSLPKAEGGFDVTDYLKWDPCAADCHGPPDDVLDESGGAGAPPLSPQRALSNALIYTFFANRVGVTLGAPYQAFFEHVAALRPYRGPAAIGEQPYLDQCYLITHIVFTLTNWGELRIDPELLPHEYYFVREHLAVQLKYADVHLVGEFVEVLRCFGADESDPLVRQGISFLLETQDERGAWDSGEDKDMHTCYHATMVGVQALLHSHYRGYGPGIPEVAPTLLRWYKDEVTAGLEADREELAAEAEAEAEATREEACEQQQNAKGAGDCGDLRVKSVRVHGKALRARFDGRAAVPSLLAALRAPLLGGGGDSSGAPAELDPQLASKASSALDRLSKVEWDLEVLNTTGVVQVLKDVRDKCTDSTLAAKAKALFKALKKQFKPKSGRTTPTPVSDGDGTG